MMRINGSKKKECSMNTTHKWNSYNDYTYQYYNERSSVYRLSAEPEQEQNEVVAVAENYNTNFLNLPAGFKIGG